MFGVPTSNVPQDHLSRGLVHRRDMLHILDIPDKQITTGLTLSELQPQYGQNLTSDTRKPRNMPEKSIHNGSSVD